VLKKLRNFLVEWIGWLAIRFIGPTLRMKMKDESGVVRNPNHKTPVIFAFWHNRMFLMPFFYETYFPGRKAACLVSASQDGEMIARVLGRFGLLAVRGSSSRRGKEAYRELNEKLKAGLDLAITPDGPRGPCYQAHLGVVSLAAFGATPIIPVTCKIDWKISLPTWDRFMIPLPFSICSVHFGKPLIFEPSEKEELLKIGKAQLEDSLNRFE
jgi:lysophospholipid acyltransferase (LPLAT)-like uncharacterized protein